MVEHALEVTKHHLRTVQVILIASKHTRTKDPEVEEMYRNEAGWGEVDNCWGSIGYVNFLLYRPPAYEDIVYEPLQTYRLHAVPKSWKKKPSTAWLRFRAERNADVRVRPALLGDMVEVALRNAAVPFTATNAP